MTGNNTLLRCGWPGKDPLMIHYHDTEWGVPVHEDRKLFEFFVLDAFQAGLSWSTVLKKRENFRKAFDNFDPDIIASYSEKKIQSLLKDPGIIRNQLKIRATVQNAKAYAKMKHEQTSFSEFLWAFVNDQPIVNQWKNLKDIPATSPESDRMSKELKKRGFSFVGSTICYAFMQAAGMVNDHTVDCFRYLEISHPKSNRNKHP